MEIKEIASTVLICVIMVGGLFFVAHLIDKNIVCPNFGKSVQLETHYNFWGGGCFVEMENGARIHKCKYQGVILTK